MVDVYESRSKLIGGESTERYYARSRSRGDLLADRGEISGRGSRGSRREENFGGPESEMIGGYHN
jgi:hypothetical protein